MIPFVIVCVTFHFPPCFNRKFPNLDLDLHTLIEHLFHLPHNFPNFEHSFACRNHSFPHQLPLLAHFATINFI